MAARQWAVYCEQMLRLVCLITAIVLASGAASADPAQRRPAPHWHGYGFLPGYQQPLNNTLPLYKQKAGTARYAHQNRHHEYIDPTPEYVGWDHQCYYFGRRGFYAARYNAIGFGPCWTQTPIGP